MKLFRRKTEEEAVRQEIAVKETAPSVSALYPIIIHARTLD